MTNAEGLQITLKEIFGGIAHEINNPLSVIYGKSAQLRRKVEMKQISEEQLMTELAKIEAMSEKISKIIKNFSSFLKSDAEHKIDQVQIDSIIDQSVILCTERFRNHGIDLKLNVEPHLEIRTYEGLLAHAIINLFILGNKIGKEFSLAEVEFKAERKNNLVEFSLNFPQSVVVKNDNKELSAFLRILDDIAAELKGQFFGLKGSQLMIAIPEQN